MRPLRSYPAAPLFDRQDADRSFIPTKARQAVARSEGPGRPFGRRAGALPWTIASPAAGFRGLGLKASLLAIGLLMAAPAEAQAPPPARPSTRNQVAQFVAEAAQRFGVPEAWILAVMRAESAFDPQAISRAGAMGLMQIMPQTYAQLRVRHGLGANPYDPRDNIMAGAAYLREMHDQFGAPGFLAAYNAGPGRYLDYVSRGRALPAETRAYVAKLAPVMLGEGQVIAASLPVAAPPDPAHSPLFAGLGAGGGEMRNSGASPPDTTMATSPPSLFVAVSSSGIGQ